MASPSAHASTEHLATFFVIASTFLAQQGEAPRALGLLAPAWVINRERPTRDDAWDDGIFSDDEARIAGHANLIDHDGSIPNVAQRTPRRSLLDLVRHRARGLRQPAIRDDTGAEADRVDDRGVALAVPPRRLNTSSTWTCLLHRLAMDR
jgi:hypothetical protein